VMGKNTDKPLTHEEIWDDSALVRSWDEAVQEYRLYHSIHANGENVEEVLRRAQECGTEGNVEAETTDQLEIPAQQTKADSSMEVEVEANETLSQEKTQHETPNPNISQKTNDCASFPESKPAESVPAYLLSRVPDEGLKNLMMAWYYAGYYTGLYEGQKRAEKESRA